VELLGHKGDLKWNQDQTALTVKVPAGKLSEIGLTLKISLA
jgi:hypothetical protein